MSPEIEWTLYQYKYRGTYSISEAIETEVETVDGQVLRVYLVLLSIGVCRDASKIRYGIEISVIVHQNYT